ncbi:TatD family hydrolase [Shewanella maritima]|uniref:TatD family hydrolase n=1 Tax=Shewanella maritima TaxID=2520507 RepID=UPI003735C958
MIDTHAHYDFDAFDECRQQVFQCLQQQGIKQVILPGVSPELWQKQLYVAEQYHCAFALGIHPWYVPEKLEEAFEQLQQTVEQNVKNDRLVAIGECGLDKLHPQYDKQLLMLKKQLEIAKYFKLPIILHCVKAHEELISILKQAKLPKAGVIHGFYGGEQLANRYIDLGFKLGIGPILLNQQAQKLHRTVENLSIEHFLIETDITSPKAEISTILAKTELSVTAITKQVASLQNISTVYAQERLFENALQLFEL